MLPSFSEFSPIILIPLLVGVITQLTKFILFSFENGLKWHYIMTHGHMPSAHSAFAISVLITTAYVDGLNSGSFVVAMALGFLILDDALRLRMYLGDQGRYLNMLVKNLMEETDLINQKDFPRLKERIGHHKSEVAVGLIYGAVLTWLFILWLS
jgi:acid phosphatase family membrane protein YuiD